MLDRPQMPPPPKDCVYGPWWDDHASEPQEMGEADGVEVIGEQQQVGDHTARWESTHEGPWLWSVWIALCLKRTGLSPTREEARRQAVEAARRMNNENV